MKHRQRKRCGTLKNSRKSSKGAWRRNLPGAAALSLQKTVRKEARTHRGDISRLSRTAREQGNARAPHRCIASLAHRVPVAINPREIISRGLFYLARIPRFLQQMRTGGIEGNPGFLPHPENLLVQGAVVGNLHQLLSHPHMIVLVAAHKAAQLHPAGQQVPVPSPVRE